MPLDPLDPAHLALSPEQRAADKFATLDRRVGVAERSSRNAVQTNNVNAAWQTPTLLNSFANVGAPYAPAAYYQDTFGRVYLRGRVTVTTGGPATLAIFTLAAGYRPPYRFLGGGYTIIVEPSGDVTVFAGGGTLTVGIDDISFRAF